MESIKKIYRTGHGPSSSHTMGPSRAAIQFKKENPNVDSYKVFLYGSLAATGKGHLTDKTIKSELGENKTEIIFDLDTKMDFHPNALKIEAFKKNKLINEQIFYSVGGGKIVKHEDREKEAKLIYDLHTMLDILKWNKESGKNIWELVFEREDNDIEDFLWDVWQNMKDSIHRGLTNEGLIPGGLRLQRKARSYYVQSKRQSKKDYTRVSLR